MCWTTLIWVALYFAIGWLFVNAFDAYDGGGEGNFVIFSFWPFILILWVLITLLFIVPEWVIELFNYRRDK